MQPLAVGSQLCGVIRLTWLGMRHVEVGGERVHDHALQFAGVALGPEFMPCLFNRQQPRCRWDQLECLCKFLRGAEAVAGAGDEEGGRSELRKVGGAELVGALGRMERVAEQEQAVADAGFGGGEHGGLTAAVGMSAEEDAARDEGANEFNGAAQSLLVALGTAARGRSVGAKLAEGEIAAEYEKSGGTARFGEGGEQRRAAVGPSAMGEDEGVCGRRVGAVEESV